VALLDGGVLVGQLVDVQGAAKSSEQVTLLLEQHPIAVAKTDAQGRFAFRGVRGGVYQLAAAKQVSGYRAWAAGTAPKTAKPAALLVAGEQLVRGQEYYYNGQQFSRYPGLTRAKYWLSNPWVVAGITTTAIAVPVGIHNADTGDGPVTQ